MVGAVGLTLKRPVAAPDYDVFAQHYVDFQKGLVEIKNKLVRSRRSQAPPNVVCYIISKWVILYLFYLFTLSK
jgi:hypothetical protein